MKYWEEAISLKILSNKINELTAGCKRKWQIHYSEHTGPKSFLLYLVTPAHLTSERASL